MKKSYIVPDTKKLNYRIESLLYTVSIWGGEGDDQEPDEAKQGIFDEESDISYSLPHIDHDVWAEEKEQTSFFYTK